jgi:hypothetical protein
MWFFEELMPTMCDETRPIAGRLTRREILAAGPLLAGSFALADLLRSEARAQV